MTGKPPFIIDAGPVLNFLASDSERVLINAIGNQPVHAPASVETEVLRKAEKNARFAHAARGWKKMRTNWIRVLSDDADNPEQIIDDQRGRIFTQKAINVLARYRQARHPVGRLQLVSTIDIIERRINTPDIPTKQHLRTLWSRISPLDDGLPNDLKETGLTTSERWSDIPGRP